MEESLHVFQEFTETLADNERDVEKIFELATEYYDKGHKEKGFALYKKAAELGSAQAQHFVANCYRFGLATTKDENEAVRWYRKAAQQGYKPSRKKLLALGVEEDI